MATRFKFLTPNAPLSVQVADAIAMVIYTSRLVAGNKLPTEALLTAQFGVSAPWCVKRSLASNRWGG